MQANSGNLPSGGGCVDTAAPGVVLAWSSRSAHPVPVPWSSVRLPHGLPGESWCDGLGMGGEAVRGAHRDV